MGAGRSRLARTLLLAVAGLLAVGALGALGFERIPLGVGLVIGAGLVIAGERSRVRRRARRDRARAKVRVLSGGTLMTQAYDLGADRSTDDQRWPM